MKVLMWAPNWDNRWLPYFKEELSRYDFTFESTSNLKELSAASRDKDLFLSMWGDGIINFWSAYFPGVPIIAYLRRYEMFVPSLICSNMWDKVDALIFVSQYLCNVFKEMPIKQPKRTYVIPNAVDLEKFPYVKTDREPTEIALVCKGGYVKNIPFAIQILAALPKQYRLSHIGTIDKRNQMELAAYASYLGVSNRISWDATIPASEMPEWFSGKDFILSTSISEGNPNNVMEGMAMGLKPIVHRWPGADEQFPGYTFTSVDEAVKLIQGDYNPLEYREIVKEKYSLANIAKIHDVIEDVCLQP